MAHRPSQAAPRKSSAQSSVAEAIRKAIFAGELQPGDPITELHVADLHKVSQTTVREALVRLEHAGLVRRIHNVGTFVTQMSTREIQERLRLRIMLEGLAGMEAARLCLPRQLMEIGQHLEQLSKAVDANDYFAAAQADLDFHRLIWSCSGDNTLHQMLDQLTVPLFAFVSMERQRRNERLADAVQAHEPIVQALRQRDPAGTQQAIRSHIERSYADFLGSTRAYTLAVG
jgi:DNA-binding GntR family transcriptional regulator